MAVAATIFATQQAAGGRSSTRVLGDDTDWRGDEALAMVATSST
jgi:hypothetical protein